MFNFICCLVKDKGNLFLVLWKTRNYCHFRCKRIRFLNRDPIMTSNIVAHRRDDYIYIIFGIENKCIIYKYEEDLIEINKLAIRDLFSNILHIESDRTANQAHIILENKEMIKLELDTLEFKFVTNSERSIEQLQMNSKFYCVLLDNKSLVIRSLETTKKMENVNATKIKQMQLIDLMNLLVLLNYKNELLAIDLLSNRIVQKKQVSEDVQSVIASKFHPLVIVYGSTGFIQIIQVVDGEIISLLGPFRDIFKCFYDEAKECLAVVSHDNNVKLFHLSLKIMGRKKEKHPVFRPVIMHSFDSNELEPTVAGEKTDMYKKELMEIVHEFMSTKEVKFLIRLEKNFEMLKTKINLTENYEFLVMMRKVNMLKYKNGVKKIAFNLVYEEFSYCHHLENKFNNIVSCTAVSSQKRFMAFASQKGPLYVYSLSAIKLIFKISDDLDSEVVDLAFTPDEKLVLKVTDANEVASWEMQTGDPIHKLKLKGPERIVSISCSPDSRYLSISREDSTIEFFDLISCRQAKQILKVHFNSVNHFVFIDNYNGLTYGMDHNMRLWAIDTGLRRGIVTGHTNRVIDALKLTDKQLISCSIDKTLRLWDIEKNFVCLRTFNLIEKEPISFDLSEDKRLLLTSEEYSTVRIYDISTNEKVWEYIETEEVKKVKWIVTAGTIFIETVSNVKVVHLFLNFGQY